MTPEQLQDRRLEGISELAEAVAAEHSLADRIEPEQILASNGITLSFGDYGDAFDGMLEYLNGSFHVYANLNRLRARDSGRARFTLAHELGHYYIDDHRRELQSGRIPRHASLADFQSTNPVEAEADHFASHLLMPTQRFIKAAKGLTLGADAVLSLKDRFGTSITSTAIRFTKLNLGPCTLIKWFADRFSWKWFSDSTFEAGYRSVLTDRDKIAADSATGKALAGHTIPEKGYFQTGTSASAWFPAIWFGTSKDVLFIEQAIPLGEFGVLTLLFPEQRRF